MMHYDIWEQANSGRLTWVERITFIRIAWTRLRINNVAVCTQSVRRLWRQWTQLIAWINTHNIYIQQIHLHICIHVLSPRYKSASRQQAVTTRRSSHPLPPHFDRPLLVHSFFLHATPLFLSSDVCVRNIKRRHIIVTHYSTLYTDILTK